MTLPTIFIISITIIFLIWERSLPGRALPKSKGWYFRSLSVNLTQMVITLLAGKAWIDLFDGTRLLNLSSLGNPAVEGFIGWFVGTFVFYWWHRLRHRRGLWQVFHQIHHSASRIEILTSFYKHPVEILANTIIATIILFPILGVSLMASFWYNLFAATGEYFYHANVRTPNWLRFFVQTPELHSIHHQYNSHSHNFSDIPIWDRLFGTYKDTTEFTERCGFFDGGEQKIAEMLVFADIHKNRKKEER